MSAKRRIHGERQLSTAVLLRQPPAKKVILMGRVLCLALAVIACLVSPSSADAQTIPECSVEQERRWDAAQRTLGATVPDALRSAGHLPAKRWLGLANWYPIDASRQLVCGEVRDTSRYIAIYPPHERDYHVFITPSTDYAFAISDVPDKAAASVKDCGGSPCVFGEVTGPDAFSTELFGPDDSPKETFCSSPGDPCWLTERQACMFGPWVMEAGHGWRPEIHPIDVMWSRPITTGATTLEILMFLDGSKRFAKAKEFDGTPPDTWLPWAPERRTVTVGFPFSVPAGGNTTISATAKTWTAGGSSTTPADQTLVRSRWLTMMGPRQAAGREADVCQAADGAVKGIAWLDMPVTRDVDAKRAGAATLVTVTHAPTAASRPTAAPAVRRMPATPVQELDDVSLTLDVVRLRQFAGPVSKVSLPRMWDYWSSSEYDLESMSALHLLTQARYVGRGAGEATAERLNRDLAACTGAACAETISVEWKFEVDTLDARQCQIVTHGRSMSFCQYGIVVSGGWLIDSKGDVITSAPGLLGGNDPGNPYRWRSLVRVDAPARIANATAGVSAVLRVSATLRDRAGHVGRLDPIEIASHTPDLVADGKIDRVAARLAEMLSRQIAPNTPGPQPVPAVLAALKIDWDLTSVPTFGEPIAKRLARTMHMWIRSSASDGQFSATELAEVRRMASRYRAVRWPP